MANHPLAHLLRYLRHLADAGQQTERTVRQLLQRFAAHHDEDAFALLVWRHTVWVPMNSVTRMCEMDSVEETRAAYREAQRGAPVTPPPQQPKKAVFGQQKNSPPSEVLMKPFFFGQTDK